MSSSKEVLDIGQSQSNSDASDSKEERLQVISDYQDTEDTEDGASDEYIVDLEFEEDEEEESDEEDSDEEESGKDSNLDISDTEDQELDLSDIEEETTDYFAMQDNPVIIPSEEVVLEETEDKEPLQQQRFLEIKSMIRPLPKPSSK